jgi:hypothetical protein
MSEHVEERRRREVKDLMLSFRLNCDPHTVPEYVRNIRDYFSAAWNAGYEAGVRDREEAKP